MYMQRELRVNIVRVSRNTTAILFMQKFFDQVGIDCSPIKVSKNISVVSELGKIGNKANEQITKFDPAVRHQSNFNIVLI